jgi:hypothetical protein
MRGRIVFSVGDALADGLVRPGGVAVLLIPGQDGAQVCLAEDHHAVQDLMAQGSDEALAGVQAAEERRQLGRIHARSLDGGPQDRGAGGLDDGVE